MAIKVFGAKDSGATALASTWCNGTQTPAAPTLLGGILSRPRSVFSTNVGAARDVYVGATVVVSDYSNHAIRLLTPSNGNVVTLAGFSGAPGAANGPVGAASFSFPRGTAFAPDGRILVVEHTSASAAYGPTGHTVRAISADRATVSLLIGVPGTLGVTLGPLAIALLRNPVGIVPAPDAPGSFYVGTASGHSVLLLACPSAVSATPTPTYGGAPPSPSPSPSAVATPTSTPSPTPPPPLGPLAGCWVRTFAGNRTQAWGDGPVAAAGTSVG